MADFGSKVKIVVPDVSGRGTTVEIDGVQMKYVRRVAFALDPKSPAIVTIEVFASEIVLEGNANVTKLVTCPACQTGQAKPVSNG